MNNVYSLIAELLISNANQDAERSRYLVEQLYKEILAINSIAENVINAAMKLQPFVEKVSTSLN